MANPIHEGDETITISVAEYEELKNDSLFLDCLRSAGVDNWDGYSYAQELLEEAEQC
jgi:hypothetical protein